MRIAAMLEGYLRYLASAKLARSIDTDDVLLVQRATRRTVAEEPKERVLPKAA